MKKYDVIVIGGGAGGLNRRSGQVPLDAKVGIS